MLNILFFNFSTMKNKQVDTGIKSVKYYIPSDIARMTGISEPMIRYYLRENKIISWKKLWRQKWGVTKEQIKRFERNLQGGC